MGEQKCSHTSKSSLLAYVSCWNLGAEYKKLEHKEISKAGSLGLNIEVA